MAPKLEQLLILQQLAAEKLETSFRIAKSVAENKRNSGFLQNASEQLKKSWNDFDQRDTEIRELIVTSKRQCNEPYILNDKFSEMQVKYLECLGDLTDGLISNTVLETTMSAPGTTIVHTGRQDTQLPKIHVPKFSGDYNEWRSFHDYFVSLIHSNAQLQPVRKFHYLRECLSGEAANIIKNLPITDSNYGPAWERITARYENKRLLVNTQLKRLVDQPKINSETSNALKMMLDTTEGCLQQLQQLGENTSSWDTIVIYILVQKLPFQTIRRWEEELKDMQHTPDLNLFKRFLQTRYKVLESVAYATSQRSYQGNSPSKKSTGTYHLMTNAKCPACDNKHYVGRCAKFLNLSIPERRRVIKSSRRCFNCFSGKHLHKNCKVTCSICNKAHHMLLHLSEPKSRTECQPDARKKYEHTHKTASDAVTGQYPENKRVDNEREIRNPERVRNFLSTENHNALLSTALVKVPNRFGKLITLRCLLDSGSQTSLITEQAYKRLQVKGCFTSVVIKGLNTSPTVHATKQVSLQLYSHKNEPVLTTELLVLKQITGTLLSNLVDHKGWGHLKGLNLADPQYWEPGPIHMLLGSDVYATILKDGIKRGRDNEPIAVNTRFGWILLGKTNNVCSFQTSSFGVVTELSENLDTQLRRFWETEEVAGRASLSREDQSCQEFYKKTHQRLPNGQYQVKLPFINNTPEFGESRNLALRRFASLERRFQVNPQFKEEYSKCLNEYLELGHMDEVDIPASGEQNYYIPHHAVMKDSTTTKLRVVFDASACSSNGRSLNQQLLAGPTLQPKLFATLLKWRKYKVAMHADIEKMYRMILVHPDHRKYQRIIWKDPKTGMLKDYQLNTVTFGTSSAPYLAVRTLLQLAEDCKSKWPLASKAVASSFYVDDLLTGAESVNDARMLRDELIDMLKSGGFNIRKWASNHLKLLEDLPTDQRELKDVLNITEHDMIKTVGIKWQPNSDYFSFALPGSKEDLYTKRSVLSIIASLYDPLGWISPVIIKAKILMQTLWMSGISWDQKIPDPIRRHWEEFKCDIAKLQAIRIPRWVGWTPKAKSVYIVGFSDASIKAYAAVVYLRTELEDGSVSCVLLTSKTKVAPIKPVTLPRLELNGAVLLARLIKGTVEDMELTSPNIAVWTDSMITLQWIQNHPNKWKTYVANRVGEIHENLPPSCWNHVSSKENPADLASRGCTISELDKSKIWWNGPQWLLQDPETWPQCNLPLCQTELERKTQASTYTCVLEMDNEIYLRFSSFHRLLRVMAFVRRFIYNAKNPNAKQVGWLNSRELQQAKIIVLKQVQRSTFSLEYAQLEMKQPISNKSKLLNLNPILDENGLIRVGGRLNKALIPYARKHPIILPSEHHIATLIIDKTHLENLHGGPTLTLNSSRNEYWILNAKRLIARRINQCVVCVRHRKQSRSQLMGNLPAARVNISKPFTHVGLDYAGPILIKTSPHKVSRKYKGYICILVCMATKAVHLEAVSDLTTATFIAAFKRFVARRGLCSDVYSDCGTNFIGGKSFLDKELIQAIKSHSNEVGQNLALKGITWHFNPPASPHHGGLWEAAVKAVKFHLRRTLANASCTYEELSTILAQIEACLNSRPLCPIENNIEDLDVLTPGHFLIGQPLNAIPESEQSHALLSQRWRYVQSVIQQFWKKWKEEYLHGLQQRSKWLRTHDNIRTNDVVLIKDETTSPTFWPLGIVEEVYPGSDGLVRVAKIRLKDKSMLTRPINKLCRLPVEPTWENNKQ